MVPRNPSTTAGSSSDVESQSGSVAAADDQFGQRPSPTPRPSPPSSQDTVDLEAQKLWEPIRSSGLNPDVKVHELANIGQRLAEQHRVLHVHFHSTLILCHYRTILTSYVSAGSTGVLLELCLSSRTCASPPESGNFFK
jgi:hypothetical protein